MTANQNFLRVVKIMYDSVKKADYSDKTTEMEKLKELKRFTEDFANQTHEVEKMLEDQIMLGIIDKNDKAILEAAVREITGEYLSN